MTIKELRTAISNSQSPEWFDKVSVDINFNLVRINERLESFSAIYLYFKKQYDGWTSMENVPSTLQTSINYFKTSIASLEQIIANSSSWNENQLVNKWDNISKNILNQATNTYTYDCPETDFLIKVNVEQPEYNQEIFNFLNAFSTNQNISPNNAKSLTAYLIAYEFIRKDHTDIAERRNAEKSSLSKIRNDFSKYLSKSEEHLNSYLAEAKQKSEHYAKSIDETKQDKETSFDTWYDEAKNNHQKFVDDTLKHRTDLEKTYRDLLRLKSPADYWSKRVLALKRDGKKYIMWLVALVVFATGLLYFLLGTIANDSIGKIFESAGTAIKWSIVFITFISLLAYGIRILAKLSFSSFHLARDAEEREQLTYLYLALKKDGNVEDADRQLVLQSLFSRADTGLLKDDSSPSMPGSVTSVVEKIMTK